MPNYDFKCRRCSHVFQRLVPSNTQYRRCDCGGRAVKEFPSSFSALNTETPRGLTNFERAFGVAPKSVGEANKLLDTTGTRPAEDYRYHRPSVERNEITEKELGECLRDHNSLGTI